MVPSRLIFGSLCILTLAACSNTGSYSLAPTRLETNPLGIHSMPVESDGLTEQAQALTASARGIVRASTLKGAMIGTAVGCGLGVLVADASSCAKAAAVGAASGAVIGHVAGKRDVARRVQLASPNALVRNLRSANDSLDFIKETLPQVLARQEAEMMQLSLSFAAGDISKSAHEQQLLAIRSQRAALAEALSLTAAEARQAAANLKDASARGHTGLDWHIAATEQLARDTLSARSNIKLL